MIFACGVIKAHSLIDVIKLNNAMYLKNMRTRTKQKQSTVARVDLNSLLIK